MRRLESKLGSRRGNAMVEFALGAGLLFALFIGAFQYGFTFYLYNELQAAVRNGARYGSMRPYKAQGASCIDKNKTMVQYATVYGVPSLDSASLPSGSQPLVRGLTTDNVTVDYGTDASGVPYEVRVYVTNFTVNALFSSFTFNNKPFARAVFLGQYAPTLCD
jgi:Flp pilus assembly protein TadG